MADVQAELDKRTQNLVLFQLLTCPFCVKVRRQIVRQGLTLQTRDIGRDPSAAAELLAGGKLDQVPCLRVERDGRFEWLYESEAINAYLKTNFAA